MNILKLELKRGKLALIIWSAAIAAMLFICLMLFPEMSGQMNEMSDAFASMGSFTEAFGMDRLNFGDAMGFYGIECGNVLSIGGAFFAAFIAVSSLAGEEKNHTAEFLLTHPVNRLRVAAEKLLSVVVQIIILNVVTMAVSSISFVLIGESLDLKAFLLLHLAYFIMQVEIAAICFAISAFIKKGGTGIGLGLAVILYFLNIIANISEEVEFMKYITPFGYAEAADIITQKSLGGGKILIGLAIALLSVFVAFVKYRKKDIS